MNLRIAVFASILAGALAGCGKTSDLAAMQDEANGIANTARTRLDSFTVRLRSSEERLRRVQQEAIPQPDLVAIRALVGTTSTRLAELQNLVRQAPTTIGDAAREPTEAERKAAAGANQAVRNPRAALTKEMVAMRAKLEDGTTEVNRNLDLFESWIAYLELRPVVVAGATPPASAPPPPPPSDEQPTPHPAGNPAE